MTGLYVTGAILICLVLLLQLRVGVLAEYSQTGAQVKVKAGPVRIQVYPPKPQKEKGPAKMKKTPEKKAGKDTFTGGSLSKLKEFLPVVTSAAGELKRKIRIDDFKMDLLWSAGDPASCAMGFGAANAAAGMIWPLVEQNFHVKSHCIRTAVDFEKGSPEVYLLASATLTVGQGLSLAIRTGVRFFKTYLRLKEKDSNLRPQEDKQTIQQKEAV